MVGTVRCAVPARVVAGGTNDRAALTFQRVAPLHAARTSQRDVPTTLNTFGWEYLFSVIELSESRQDRSADFSPLPAVLAGPDRSGLKSALLNSMAVGSG